MLYGELALWRSRRFQMKDGVTMQPIELSVGPLPEHLEEGRTPGVRDRRDLSSMYSALYNEMTLVPDDGKVRAAQARARPWRAGGADPRRLLGPG